MRFRVDFLSYSSLFTLVLLLVACGQSSPQAMPEPGELTLKTAVFTGTVDYSAKGSAQFIQQGSNFLLRFADDFEVSAGPDLHVWLVKDEADLSSVIDLGSLKANQNAQEYSLPEGSQINDYSHVYIWCELVSELFGKADFSGTTSSPTEPPLPEEPEPSTPETPEEPENPNPSNPDPENNIPVAAAQSLSVSAGTSLNITLSASDSDLDTLSYRITRQPTQGSLSSLQNDMLSYTANSNALGSDSFEFVANDGKGDSAPAIITLELIPAVAPTPEVILTAELVSLDSRGSVQVVQTGLERSLELLDNFRANGTNDISVWLAEDSMATGFIDLGRINISGAQSITIPDGIDLSQLNHVIIWCNQFPSIIGEAELR